MATKFTTTHLVTPSQLLRAMQKKPLTRLLDWIRLSRPAIWLSQRDAPQMLAALFAVAVICITATIMIMRQAAPVVAPLQPILIIASVTPSLPKPGKDPAVASAYPNLLTSSIVVYYEPSDQAEPHPVDAGKHYKVLARAGETWLQIEVDQNVGTVWAHTTELLGARDLADLAPPTSAPIIASQPDQQFGAMNAQQPQSVEDAVSTPAPAPTSAPLPTPSDNYIENVGAQAPHSPRGGLCGPTSGDCTQVVPGAGTTDKGTPYGLDTSDYIQNVGDAHQGNHPHR